MSPYEILASEKNNIDLEILNLPPPILEEFNSVMVTKMDLLNSHLR
jgi:hypothetical protein